MKAADEGTLLSLPLSLSFCVDVASYLTTTCSFEGAMDESLAPAALFLFVVGSRDHRWKGTNNCTGLRLISRGCRVSQGLSGS